MIFDTRKSFRIVLIDCSVTTFNSSHDDESSAVLSASAADVVASGDDGGKWVRVYVWRELVEQRECDLPHAFIPRVEANRSFVQL